MKPIENRTDLIPILLRSLRQLKHLEVKRGLSIWGDTDDRKADTLRGKLAVYPEITGDDLLPEGDALTQAISDFSDWFCRFASTWMLKTVPGDSVYVPLPLPREDQVPQIVAFQKVVVKAIVHEPEEDAGFLWYQLGKEPWKSFSWDKGYPDADGNEVYADQFVFPARTSLSDSQWQAAIEVYIHCNNRHQVACFCK